MGIHTRRGTVAKPSGARRRLLLVLLPVLLVAGALMPASAFAQQSSSCDADVSSTQGEAVADFTVDCGSDPIVSVNIGSSESGSIEGADGTTCDGDGTSFTCSPGSGSDTSVAGSFTPDDGTFCDGEPTMLTFTAETDSGTQESQTLEAPCEDLGGGGGGGTSGEDDGTFPEGGIDSGTAATATRASGLATWPPFVGLGLTVLVVSAAGILVARRGAR